MSGHKVLISDKVDEICITTLHKKGCDVQNTPGISADELKECITEFDALIVRSATSVSREVIQAASRLRVIGRAGTGVDNIDILAATENGITVLNTPGGNTISAAEQTFALMISLARLIPAAHMSMVNGEWNRSAYSGVELYQKTLGIIGLGQIGKEIARRAAAFGMDVIAYDPILSPSDFEAAAVKEVEFDDLIRTSDFITLHVPLNKHTRNLISDDEFEICKKELRLINVARGGVVDENALYRALENERIAGAALDVYENEPPQEFRFSKFKNVVTTPHLGASTIDAQKRVALQIAETITDYLDGKKVLNIVTAV